MKKRDWTFIQNQFRNKLQESYIRGLQKGTQTMATLIMDKIQQGTTLADIHMLCKRELKRVNPNV